MITQRDIDNFCLQNNYDLRISGNGRWIDQKCTADVLSAVSDCIHNYSCEHDNEEFTTKDVWHATYTIENVEQIFRKPGVASVQAQNEYDKFFQQPMEMLAYAGVLGKRKNGKRNIYWVEHFDILEHIALRERNALYFIKAYCEKVLKDSQIYYMFEDFFENQDKESFKNLKKGYSSFIIDNTKINGEVECNRIFTKVINPLAYYNNLRGTEKGNLSKHAITYDMLMYNRNNFRDIYANKPKGITRKEYAAANPVDVNTVAYYKYQSTKAKRFLRLFNDQNRNSLTEHLDGRNGEDAAIHMHHIFPESEYPEISFYVENLIALTPTQHLNYAHPNGNTHEISEQYQQLLLLSKSDRIEENLTDNDIEDIYKFEDFLYVLNVGFDNESVLDIENMNFPAVVNAINVHYSRAPVMGLVAEDSAEYIT